MLTHKCPAGVGSPPPAQRQQEVTSFDTLLAAAQLAQSCQSELEQAYAGHTGGRLPGSAAGIPAIYASVPTPLPRALIECGVSCVLSHLSFEDQQRLEEARAFLAAI